jgi:hypothetical protein
VLGSIDGLDHWSDDDVGVDDCEVKDGLLGCEEVPCGFFGEFLGRIIPENWGLRFHCSFHGDLNFISSRFKCGEVRSYWIPILLRIIFSSNSDILIRIQNSNCTAE